MRPVTSRPARRCISAGGIMPGRAPGIAGVSPSPVPQESSLVWRPRPRRPTCPPTDPPANPPTRPPAPPAQPSGRLVAHCQHGPLPHHPLNRQVSPGTSDGMSSSSRPLHHPRSQPSRFAPPASCAGSRADARLSFHSDRPNPLAPACTPLSVPSPSSPPERTRTPPVSPNGHPRPLATGHHPLSTRTLLQPSHQDP